MHEVYGSEPKDIVAAIGPSICQSCYEVSDDVAEAFRANFTADEAADILLDKGNGKYQLDLWKANWYVLTDAGICGPIEIHMGNEAVYLRFCP